MISARGQVARLSSPGSKWSAGWLSRRSSPSEGGSSPARWYLLLRSCRPEGGAPDGAAVSLFLEAPRRGRRGSHQHESDYDDDRVLAGRWRSIRMHDITSNRRSQNGRLMRAQFVKLLEAKSLLYVPTNSLGTQIGRPVPT